MKREKISEQSRLPKEDRDQWMIIRRKFYLTNGQLLLCKIQKQSEK